MVQASGFSKNTEQTVVEGVKGIASQFEFRKPEPRFRRPIDPSLLNRPSLKESIHAVVMRAATASRPTGESAAKVDPVLTSSSRSTVREAARQVAAAGNQMAKNQRAAGAAVLEAIRHAAARGLPVRVAATRIIAAAETEKDSKVVGREVVEAVRYASAMEVPVKVAAAYHEEIVAELLRMQSHPARAPPASTTPRGFRRTCDVDDVDDTAGFAEGRPGELSVGNESTPPAPRSAPAALRGSAVAAAGGNGEPAEGSSESPSSSARSAGEREKGDAALAARSAYSDAKPPAAAPPPAVSLEAPRRPTRVSYFEVRDDQDGSSSAVPSIIDLMASSSEPATDWNSTDYNELFGDGLDIMDLSARARGTQLARPIGTVSEHDAFIIEEADVRAAIQQAEVAQRRSKL